MPAPPFTDVVGAIYDAAADELPWTEVGDQLCELVGARRAYLGLPQADGSLPNLLRVGDPLDREYSERYHRVDPVRMLSWHAALLGQLKPAARRVSDFLPERRFFGSEYYTEYARQRGTRSSIAAQIDESGQLLLGIFREHRSDGFDDSEVGSVNLLLPHFRRGLQLRKMMAQRSPETATSGFAALDAVPLAVFVVTNALEIVFANEAAEKMTARRGAALRMSRVSANAGARCALSAVSASDSTALRLLVAETLASGAGGALRVRSPVTESDRDPVVAVLVSPAPSRLVAANPAGAGRSDDVAMVVARDLTAPTTPDPRLFSELFGLSPGEASVASALLGGATAEHVAAMRNVSINTVRRQIQGVLQKTEAANLRDLERIAAFLMDMRAGAGRAGVEKDV